MEEKECKHCKDFVKEIEELRHELCAIRDGYSRVCEKLWTIANKKRE